MVTTNLTGAKAGGEPKLGMSILAGEALVMFTSPTATPHTNTVDVDKSRAENWHLAVIASY